MPRQLVVETEAAAGVADLGEPAGEFAGTRAARRAALAAGPGAARISRLQRIAREQVLDVGEQQLLMLLLVMQADRDDLLQLRRQRVALQQALHLLVHVRAIGPHLFDGRPRQQAALGAAVPRPDGFVVGIEEIAERRIEEPCSPRAPPAARIPRRTSSCARGATWPGSRPAWTGWRSRRWRAAGTATSVAARTCRKRLARLFDLGAAGTVPVSRSRTWQHARAHLGCVRGRVVDTRFKRIVAGHPAQPQARARQARGAVSETWLVPAAAADRSSNRPMWVHSPWRARQSGVPPSGLTLASRSASLSG